MSTWFSLMTPRSSLQAAVTLVNTAGAARRAGGGRGARRLLRRVRVHRPPRRRPRRAGRRPRPAAAAARAAHQRPRRRRGAGQRDAGRGPGSPPAGPPRPLGLAPARGRPASAPLATRIAVETAMAMVDVIRADELSRLGVCADADCDGVVLDLSRNRSRRFCSTACGNRNAVAAYRARQPGRAARPTKPSRRRWAPESARVGADVRGYPHICADSALMARLAGPGTGTSRVGREVVGVVGAGVAVSIGPSQSVGSGTATSGATRRTISSSTFSASPTHRCLAPGDRRPPRPAGSPRSAAASAGRR